jgi:hypothetical protein
MKSRVSAKIEPTITFTVSETEAHALVALSGYGFKVFIDTFYKTLGKHYMEPYESGLKSLFDFWYSSEFKQQLNKIEQARKLINT